MSLHYHVNNFSKNTKITNVRNVRKYMFYFFNDLHADLAVKIKLWFRTYASFNLQFSKDTDEMFKDKLQKEKTGHVNNKDLENKKQDQRHETGRLKHARTEENVTTANE